MRKAGYFLGAVAAAALGAAATASETVTYRYDALGRLEASVHSGGVNNGQAQSLCYDPAGNRALYQSSASGSLASCGGGSLAASSFESTSLAEGGIEAEAETTAEAEPTAGAGAEPIAEGNEAPTAVDDGGIQGHCTTVVYEVTANDTDPNGHYPLTLVSVAGADFSIHSPAALQFVSGASAGAKTATYTVQDSLGATATATLTVDVSGGNCP